MQLTVKKALELPVMTGAEVHAGEAGLDRVVECVTVMEIPDISPWMRGNEVVLTSLYSLWGNPEAQIQLIPQLAEVGVSALLVKAKTYVKELPEEMVDEAERLGFPLIEVPPETPYVDVLNGIMAEIFNRSTMHRHANDKVVPSVKTLFGATLSYTSHLLEEWVVSSRRGPLDRGAVRFKRVKSRGGHGINLGRRAVVKRLV